MEALSRFTDPAKPWTRRAFDNQFAQGRAWLEEEFKAAGLQSKWTRVGISLAARRELAAV